MNIEIEDLLRWESESRGKGTARDQLKRERLVGHLVKLGEIKADSRVLSVGCGTGYYELVVKTFSQSLFCLDSSRQMLTICKRRGFKNLIRGSAFCLPLRSGSFDCVYALSLDLVGSTWSTKYTRSKAVQEMKRVAAEGGKIVTGHPTTIWKQLRGMLEHGKPNVEKFRVSPDEVVVSYRENNLKSLRLLVLPPVPYLLLKRMDYSKFDRPLSRLLLNRLGPYLLISGVK